MDAISSLVAGVAQAQAQFDTAARQVAVADLPSAVVPQPTAPAAPDPSNNVDVAEQLTTMMVAADAHHLTTTALKAALEVYKEAVDILPQD